MNDERLLEICLNKGISFYRISSLNFILAEMADECYIYKCYDGNCISQSSRKCDGRVNENYVNVLIEHISKNEFESIWCNLPEVKFMESRYKCPHCKN